MGREQQHTLGPWEYQVSENSPDNYSITANGGDPQIAEVERWNGDGDESEAALEAEANACLIAAAPDLKDNAIWTGCKIQELMSAFPPESVTFKALQKILFAQYKAIAKARGATAT